MKTPRPHQEEALQATINTLKKHDRAQVHMACGTGKTLLMAMIYVAMRVRKTVVFFPSLDLLRQTWVEFAEAIPSGTRLLAVCSPLGPKGPQTTTTVSEIQAFLDAAGPSVLFCTYQSSHLLKEQRFDLGLFDEAHRTAGSQSKAFSYALSDENVPISKRVFLTATPKHLEVGEDVPVFSMDDEEAYGPTAYSFSFREAVKKRIICNYKVIISILKQPVDGTKTHAALQAAVTKAVKKYDLNHVLTYHRSIAEAEEFVSTFKRTPKGMGRYHVSSNQKASDRALSMAEFKRSGSALMSNARCLTEGVDIPGVDLVVFAQAKSDFVAIVQAIGRSVRRNKDKKTGYILLPLYLDQVAGETLEQAALRQKFGAVLSVLQVLQEQDEVMSNLMKLMATKNPPGSKPGSTEELWEVDGEDFSPEELKKLRKAIDVQIVKALTTSLAPRADDDGVIVTPDGERWAHIRGLNRVCPGIPAKNLEKRLVEAGCPSMSAKAQHGVTTDFYSVSFAMNLFRDRIHLPRADKNAVLRLKNKNWRNLSSLATKFNLNLHTVSRILRSGKCPEVRGLTFGGIPNDFFLEKKADALLSPLMTPTSDTDGFVTVDGERWAHMKALAKRYHEKYGRGRHCVDYVLTKKSSCPTRTMRISIGVRVTFFHVESADKIMDEYLTSRVDENIFLDADGVSWSSGTGVAEKYGYSFTGIKNMLAKGGISTTTKLNTSGKERVFYLTSQVDTFMKEKIKKTVSRSQSVIDRLRTHQALLEEM